MLKKIWKNWKKDCSDVANRAKKWCAALLGLMLVYGIALETPQIHRDWLRSSVGSQVVKLVKVQNGKIRGGGTGWVVKAPSGQTYTVTNAHVCDAFKPENTVIAQLPDGTLIPRKILHVSDLTDLCLVEAIPGYSGLDLAGWVDIGEELSIVGHPHLQPLTISKGELVGNEEVAILDGIIGMDMEEGSCNKPKNRIVEAMTFFGPLKLCLVVVQAQVTTIPTLGGNSGSPVVNKWGNVVGVLFAGPGGDGANWGRIVTLKDLRQLLASY